MVILFVVNISEFFISHRLPIALAAKRLGFEVHLASGTDYRYDWLEQQGIYVHKLPLSRSGTCLKEEVKTICVLYNLIASIRPDLVHLVTMKPVLYGGLVASFAKVKALVFSISGLGSFYLRAKQSWIKRLGLRTMMFLTLRHKNMRVIVQNDADQATVSKWGKLNRKQVILIKGSGISLSEFSVIPQPTGILVVAFIGRLLSDKGVFDFVEAAKLLKPRFPGVVFALAGDIDEENPSSITQDQMREWSEGGIVETRGHVSDIRSILRQASIVVLPSYREGFPRTLMEASASERAVITTDVAGCRDAVMHDITGYLVPPRDPRHLAEAIASLIDSPEKRLSFGIAGRRLAEQEFSIDIVVQKHMEIYRKLLGYDQ